MPIGCKPVKLFYGRATLCRGCSRHCEDMVNSMSDEYTMSATHRKKLEQSGVKAMPPISPNRSISWHLHGMTPCRY